MLAQAPKRGYAPIDASSGSRDKIREMKTRLLVLALLFLAPATADAQEAPAAGAEPPSVDAHPAPSDALPAGTELSGREIYERVLANRFKASFQKQRIISVDPGGSQKVIKLWARWKDYRDPHGRPTDTVLSKTLVKYTAPNDVRHSGYLIIQKQDEPDDQFVYMKSSRRVRRVALGESIMGTDFSLEDIVPRNIDASDYLRTLDEAVDGAPCYVVEVRPKVESDSDYSRILVYVEKQRFVTLRARYWNLEEIEVKEFNAPHSTLKEVRGVWVATEGTMRSLIDGTHTTLHVDEIDPEAPNRDSIFSVSHLKRHSR